MFSVASTPDAETHFQIDQRQNLLGRMDYSCGTIHSPRGAPALMLARYNGPGHVHGDIAYRPHVHRALERNIAAGRRAESGATESSEFETLEGAIASLMKEFNVKGLEFQRDTPRLKS